MARMATRKRYNPSTIFWAMKLNCVFTDYGKIEEYKDYAILVEGESDSQSLWSLDFNALGVPGSTNFKAEWTEHLMNIPKLYLHKEP